MVFSVGNRVRCTNHHQTWDLTYNGEYVVSEVIWNNAGNQQISLASIPNRSYSAHRFMLVSDSMTNTGNTKKASGLTFEDRFVEEMTGVVVELLDYEGVITPDELCDMQEWESLVSMCRNLGYKLDVETNPKVLLTKL